MKPVHPFIVSLGDVGAVVPTRAKRFLWLIIPTAVLLLEAAIVRFGIAPALELLSANYSSEITLDADTRFRETSDAPALQVHEKGRRTDRVMIVQKNVAIIQSRINWSTDSGQVNYQKTGLYGVDRRTRRNISGYGDRRRSGQFLFPPRLVGVVDQVWDPYYGGARHLAFVRMEVVAGLTLDLYHFDVAGLDETDTYDFLPEVPEHYRATTEGQGWLWIEPLSGILVDVVDQGHTYFADPVTGQSAGDINVWDARYTASSKMELITQALDARRRVTVFDIWIPLELSGLAFIWVAGSLLRLWLGRHGSLSS